jgi:uncharacterized protein YrrD
MVSTSGLSKQGFYIDSRGTSWLSRLHYNLKVFGMHIVSCEKLGCMSRKENAAMLRSLEELYGYKIQATGGSIGEVYDFYFDDDSWTIRYLVMDTGGWLSGRLVIISTVALEEPDWKKQIFPVSVTKEQIEKGPSAYTEKSISRRHESTIHKYYGWPFYWSDKTIDSDSPSMERRDSHLISTREVSGYHIQAMDDSIGHVEDFIFDDETWALCYILVNIRNWLPGGKKVLVSCLWIRDVIWGESKVSVDVVKETIAGAPDYDPEIPIDRDYEERIHNYYGLPKYWD